jgi:hypothetical protein
MPAVAGINTRHQAPHMWIIKARLNSSLPLALHNKFVFMLSLPTSSLNNTLFTSLYNFSELQEQYGEYGGRLLKSYCETYMTDGEEYQTSPWWINTSWDLDPTGILDGQLRLGYGDPEPSGKSLEYDHRLILPSMFLSKSLINHLHFAMS